MSSASHSPRKIVRRLNVLNTLNWSYAAFENVSCTVHSNEAVIFHNNTMRPTLELVTAGQAYVGNCCWTLNYAAAILLTIHCKIGTNFLPTSSPDFPKIFPSANLNMQWSETWCIETDRKEWKDGEAFSGKQELDKKEIGDQKDWIEKYFLRKEMSSPDMTNKNVDTSKHWCWWCYRSRQG